MLRCPKCGRIYQDGTQRFCTYDGGRLLPSSESNQFVPPQIASYQEAKNQQPEVFKPTSEQTFGNSSEQSNFPPPFGNQPPLGEKKRATGRLTKPEGFIELPGATPEIPNVPFSSPKFETFSPPPVLPPNKPTGRLIKPKEIPLGHIDVNDPSRLSGKLNLNLNSETAERFVGQNVKGRYFVEKLIRQDALGATYSAQDNFTPGKRVVVYIFMRELPVGNAAVRQFQEEKIALSHLSSPSLAGILDSGELLDGKAFIVREYVDGKTLHAVMEDIGQFSPPRAARIIRQVAQALSEAHNNRILHRDLRPENIILKQIETGLEQARVVDFGISGLRVGLLSEEENADSLAYQSPERIVGQPLSAESDVYSLAVIAYELMTARKPFQYRSANDLLERQRDGLSVRPTTLRSDISSMTDAVLQKALNYDKSQRYQSAREFGESFYSALTGDSMPLMSIPPISPQITSPAPPLSTPFPTPISNSFSGAPSIPRFDETMQFNAPASTPKPDILSNAPETPDFSVTTPNFSAEVPKIPTTKPLEKMSETPVANAKAETPGVKIKPNSASVSGRKSSFGLPLLLAGLFGLLLFLGVVGVGTWYFLTQMNTPTTTVKKIEPTNPPTENPTTENPPPITTNPTTENPPTENPTTPPISNPPVSNPPNPTKPTVPDGFTAFQNEKSGLMNPNLAKNAVGFSLAYPSDWEKNPIIGTKAASNFLDIAKRSGKKPIEQLLISWYGSEGTFDLDNQKKFKDYAPQLKGLFAKQIPKYQQIGEGPTTFNGKPAYEVKFQGEEEEVQIWGRTVFLPVGKEGAKTGLMITMLATSFDTEVTGVEDLGNKGDLAKIVETFKLE